MSDLVQLFINKVKKGELEIEEVPEFCREEVQEALNE